MPAARRPLRSRDTALARRLARWLAATRVTPNQVSAASLVFAALAGGAFWAASGQDGAARGLLLAGAAAAVQMRLVCNLLDGMVAVEGGKGTPDGAFWNEAPDRPSDILILAGMGVAAGDASLGWAAACLAVLTAYLRELGVSAGQPADFSGPMAKPQRMAVATAAALGAAVLPWNLLAAGLWIIVAGSAVTAARRSARLLRGLRDRRP